jgi:site-specific recombinase XerD
MTLKKKEFAADEFPIYDDAVVFMRGEFWQFRMWLANEHKYARFSLKTRNKTIAVEKAKLHYHELKAQELAGKTYFSKTIKQGVELYLAQRQKDVDAGRIVKGRWGTIRTHLEHFMDLIGRDTKLKELHRMDCENYYLSRNKMKKSVNVSITTIANEQSTINALINWLYKHGETYIDAFEFPAFKKIDRGDEELRRSIFDEEEIWQMRVTLESYVANAKRDLDTDGNLSKFVTGLYLLISMITGMRRGEQLQLKWKDIEFKQQAVKEASEDDAFNLVRIHIDADISKVKKTRNIYVHDNEYFLTLQEVMLRRYIKENGNGKSFQETLVFSLNAEKSITPRAISYHLDKIIEIADIKNIEKRNLVPYSFRHSFITHMINNGADERAVADMCGTSRLQIEKTYYHVTEKRMIENSMPNLRYEDGMLILPDSMKRKL